MRFLQISLRAFSSKLCHLPGDLVSAITFFFHPKWRKNEKKCAIHAFKQFCNFFFFFIHLFFMGGENCEFVILQRYSSATILFLLCVYVSFLLFGPIFTYKIIQQTFSIPFLHLI